MGPQRKGTVRGGHLRDLEHLEHAWLDLRPEDEQELDEVDSVDVSGLGWVNKSPWLLVGIGMVFIVLVGGNSHCEGRVRGFMG